MRVVFCGTPDFAVPSLRRIVEGGVEVPLVVSQPDKVRGRRGKPSPSPVRAAAIELDLQNTVLERGGRDQLYEQILACKPDVVVVVAFGHIIREPLLNGAPLGCVNVHASLLPRWRGPAPIHTAIVAGDAETGVCTMKLAAGVDTGDIYECASTAIDPDESTGTLHDRLAALGADTLLTTLNGLAQDTLDARPQSGQGITHAPMLTRAEGGVDFDNPAQRVHDRIRGMQPWPGIRVQWQQQPLKIFDSTLLDRAHDAAPGDVLGIEDDGMIVACRDRALRIGRVQAEGKRPVTAAAFAHGHGLAAGQRLLPVDGFEPREPRG
ncbi:methionyl-tRNA formyltransferase [bacterium]|nr:MAG: methionyl-tRNA formyltransferase [bacterium]RKZ15691.1 MAG: methionyl-tRNA formyltransferase [bacterium]